MAYDSQLAYPRLAANTKKPKETIKTTDLGYLTFVNTITATQLTIYQCK
jgi:hypothetical protein